MRRNCAFPLSQGGPLPSQAQGSTARAATTTAGACQSAANRTSGTNREPCCGCGCVDWLEARWHLGRIWCRVCWEGSQRPATSMVPTKSQAAQLSLWIAGQPGARP
jgi:hypothetical protein